MPPDLAERVRDCRSPRTPAHACNPRREWHTRGIDDRSTSFASRACSQLQSGAVQARGGHLGDPLERLRWISAAFAAPATATALATALAARAALGAAAALAALAALATAALVTALETALSTALTALTAALIAAVLAAAAIGASAVPARHGTSTAAAFAAVPAVASSTDAHQALT